VDNPSQEINFVDPHIDQTSIKRNAPETSQDEPREDK